MDNLEFLFIDIDDNPIFTIINFNFETIQQILVYIYFFHCWVQYFY